MGNYTTLARMAGRAHSKKRPPRSLEATVAAVAPAYRCGGCGDTSVAPTRCDLCDQPMVSQRALRVPQSARAPHHTLLPLTLMFVGFVAPLIGVHPWLDSGIWAPRSSYSIDEALTPWDGGLLVAALALAFASLSGLIALGLMQVTAGRRAARKARRRLEASPHLDECPALGTRGLVEGVLRIEDGQAELTRADGSRLKVRVVDESRAYVGHQRCGGLDDGARVRLIGETLRQPGPSAGYRTDAGDAEVAIDVLEVLTPGMTPRSRGA